jgi:hypothetical protein
MLILIQTNDPLGTPAIYFENRNILFEKCVSVSASVSASASASVGDQAAARVGGLARSQLRFAMSLKSWF